MQRGNITETASSLKNVKRAFSYCTDAMLEHDTILAW